MRLHIKEGLLTFKCLTAVIRYRITVEKSHTSTDLKIILELFHMRCRGIMLT